LYIKEDGGIGLEYRKLGRYLRCLIIMQSGVEGRGRELLCQK
jgi:hypothetical protein